MRNADHSESKDLLYGRALRPPEVIVWEPASGVVTQHGEGSEAGAGYANTRSSDSVTTALSEVVTPLWMTSWFLLTI